MAYSELYDYSFFNNNLKLQFNLFAVPFAGKISVLQLFVTIIKLKYTHMLSHVTSIILSQQHS